MERDDKEQSLIGLKKVIEESAAGWAAALERVIEAELKAQKPRILRARIEDPWMLIGDAASDGSFRSKYPIGAYKEVDFGPEGLIRMQLAQVEGRWAHFVAMDPLRFPHRMNQSLKYDSEAYAVEGTGGCGGWLGAELRDYLNSVTLGLLQENFLFDLISDSGRGLLWVPSIDEVFGDEYEKFPIFTDEKSAVRRMSGKPDEICMWWLRSRMNDRSFACVADDTLGSTPASESLAVIVCFSIELAVPESE